MNWINIISNNNTKEIEEIEEPIKTKIKKTLHDENSPEALSQKFDNKYNIMIGDIIFDLLDQYDDNVGGCNNIRIKNRSKLNDQLYDFIKENSSELYKEQVNEDGDESD
tara:strand:+ start:320 stop:646 length:327 start_codon:yes stop_codon:yes gene_type:complete